jgi:hypothetical protein
MSGLTCQNADGTKVGLPCDKSGNCTSPLFCDKVNTGLCQLQSTGKIGQPCMGDAYKCDTTDYAGLVCTSTDPNVPGTCECGISAQSAAKLCDDNKICASASGPGPGPGPGPGVSWPDATFPNASDDEKKTFTGYCKDSSWFTGKSGNCPPGNLGAKDGSGNVACIPPANWKDASSGTGYSNFCLVASSRR